MGTQHTTLCLVNFSGRDIEQTTVAVDHGDNWDGPSRPDQNMGGPLANQSSRCERAEIDRGTNNGCWFTVTVDFKGGGSLTFRGNQWDVYSEQRTDRAVSVQHATEGLDLEVVQRTGKDRYTYTNAYYIRPSTAPDNARWMVALLNAKPNIRLNELTMPGSHDAGMYTDVTDKARTQRLDVYYQMKAGARYFDLRVYKSGNELLTYHSIYDGGKLEAILDGVSLFLAEDRGETVFLKFRSYASGDQADTVALVKRVLGRQLYTSATVPNFATEMLSTLKGKAVAVFTPAYASLLNPAEGIFPYQDYGNEDTGADTPPSNDLCFGVYDSYAHQSDLAEMVDNQNKKWANHKARNKPYLFLLSWTLTGSTDNILDLDLLSNTANPQLPKELHTLRSHAARDGLPNIIYIDEIDAWLCGAIIDLNR